MLPSFKSKLSSRKSKITSSTWTTTKADEKKFEVFERKILKKIFGPKKNNEGYYEIRNNKNLEKLCKKLRVVGTLKSAPDRANGMGRTRMAIKRSNWINNYLETKHKETQTKMDR